MGAWIETSFKTRKDIINGVAPHVGAWIETYLNVRGLRIPLVAPHVGAWIETKIVGEIVVMETRRTPCGCVD